MLKKGKTLTDIISQNGSFSGQFSASEVNGPDVKAGNNFDKENVKTVVKPSFNVGGTKFTYTFPAHSFTLLKGKIAK